MKIFVTGGAGFIGRNIIHNLLDQSHEIIIFDNFSNSSYAKTKELFKGKATIINGDITNYESINNSIKNSELIIHLAAKIDVNESILNPKEFNRINVAGTLNLLQSCVKNNIQNLIAASSAAVYGSQSSVPILETALPNPLSPYGASKLAMEAYMKAFANNFEINCISLRFFNIFGIDQTSQYAGVITKFIEKIQQGLPLQVFGDGDQTRDFISIKDVIHSINDAIKKIDKKRGNIYNIGTGNPTSVNGLVKMFENILKKKLEVKKLDEQKGEIKQSFADISLAKKELDFNPRVNLKEGLKEILLHKKILV